MKRLFRNQWLRSKTWWIYCLLIIFIPLLLFFYNRSHVDETYNMMKQFVESEQKLISMHLEMSRFEKEINPQFDVQGTYDHLLIESGKTLTKWSNDLFYKNYYSYEHELKLYDLYQQIEKLPKFIPLTLDRNEEMEVKKQRAELMKRYHLSCVEEQYPTSSIFFVKQLTEWLFSGATALIFI
ncbi:hypothetical protein JDW15_08750 [Aerococcaceae bacterium zg-ZJ1578]|uniref:hypothetical protein n=1 Tax=Aerococcaceae bacterium zg-252 TaxID=2796928 RepID=UPI001A277D89|nr:hypothetical protein [Aerococcaceae bacterium zg-1578]